MRRWSNWCSKTTQKRRFYLRRKSKVFVKHWFSVCFYLRSKSKRLSHRDSYICRVRAHAPLHPCTPFLVVVPLPLPPQSVVHRSSAAPTQPAATIAEAIRTRKRRAKHHRPRRTTLQNRNTPTKSPKTPATTTSILESWSLIRVSPLLRWGRGEDNTLKTSRGQFFGYVGGNLT